MLLSDYVAKEARWACRAPQSDGVWSIVADSGVVVGDATVAIG